MVWFAQPISLFLIICKILEFVKTKYVSYCDYLEMCTSVQVPHSQGKNE